MKETTKTASLAQQFHLPLQGDNLDAVRQDFNNMIDAKMAKYYHNERTVSMAKKTVEATKRVMDYESVKGWENRVEEVQKEYSKYGNVPVPAKYQTKKVKGVAAFDTVPEAEALAQELTELIHYQHIVELDSEFGCAVVIITNKLFIPIEDSNVTMGMLQKNWKDFFNPKNAVFYAQTASGIGNFAFSTDGEVKVGENDVVFLQEVPLQSLETVENRTLEYLQKYTRDRAYKLNAAVLTNYKINKALIMIYGNSDLCDAFGEEIDCGETLYKNDNSTISIGKISLKKSIHAVTIDKKVLSYYWDAEDANGNHIDLSECKKNLWSSKERKEKDLLTDKDIAEANEKKEIRTNCIQILAVVLIMGIVITLACYGYNQSRIVDEREIDVTVTKVYSKLVDDLEYLDGTKTEMKCYVLTDNKGNSMTFRDSGAHIPTEGKITVTLSTMKCGKTIVSYNGKEIDRIA